MRVRVKICGFTTEEGIDAAIACGVDAVGFVFAASPRRVTPERATVLAVRIPSAVLKVAVFASPTAEEVRQALACFSPDRIQIEAEALGGLDVNERARAIPVFHDAPARLDAIGPFCGDLEPRGGSEYGPDRVEVGSIGATEHGSESSREESIDRMLQGPAILLDGRVSGRGELGDWNMAARIARIARVVLAGGLSPENVAHAIRVVRPYGVDVSSGVESSPGVKDPDRIAAFAAAVREAEGQA